MVFQSPSLVAQGDSTISNTITKTEKTKIKKNTNRKKLLPPTQAILWGILPGGGQIYNKRYWKLPIVYGGIGGLGYLMFDYNNKYQCYRNAYKSVVNGDTVYCKFDVDSLTNSAQLKILRDNFQRNLEFSIIGFSVFYALTLVDAFVDAHLMTFDISDDLSLQIAPRLQYQPTRKRFSPALRFSIQITPPKRTPPPRLY